MSVTWVMLACGVGLGLCLAYIFRAFFNERTASSRKCFGAERKRVKRDQEHDAPRIRHPLGL
jgi:hypothetical protein